MTARAEKKKRRRFVPKRNLQDGDSRGEAEGVERDSGRLGHGKV